MKQDINTQGNVTTTTITGDLDDMRRALLQRHCFDATDDAALSWVYDETGKITGYIIVCVDVDDDKAEESPE